MAKRAAGMTNSVLPPTLSTLLQAASMPSYGVLGRSEPSFAILYKQALQLLHEEGLPTQKDESYRFARLGAIFQNILQLPEHSALMEYIQLPFLGYNLKPEEVYSLRCINGKYIASEGERLVRLPSGIIYGSTAQALDEFPDLVLPYLARRATQPLDALCTLLAQDGFFIYVPEGVKAEKPFLLTLVEQGPDPLLINQRSLIILDGRAELQCYVSEHTLSESRFVSNRSLDCFVGTSSHLSVLELQNVHKQTTVFNHLAAQLNNQATFQHKTVTLRGGFIRNEIAVDLGGQYAEVNLSGLALVDAGQYVDTVTHLDHRVANGSSSQLYKTLVDKGGEYSFFGHIHVHRNAQKTQAYQRNANVLVESGGVVHTRPQLLIDADDVKCSHGATVGHLDEEARFYMLTRGIPQNQVTRLLMRAFLQDVLTDIRHATVQEQVEQLVDARLRGE